MKVDNEMTTKEISRLAEWLKNKGLSAEEILNCIDYIANRDEKRKNTESPIDNN